MNRIVYAPKLPKLMALLGSKGWNWSRLARESGRDRPHLSRLMGGHHRAGADFAEDVAAALGVEVSEIWEVTGA